MKKPGLIIATLVGVAILFSLGWWQKERLAWKTDKLAEIDMAAEAPPLRRVEDILTLYQAGKPLDFRRVELRHDGRFGEAGPFRVFRAGDGIAWELFTPHLFGKDALFVSGQTIPDGATLPKIELPNPLVGYVRAYEAEDVEGGNYSVEENRYYGFNPDQTWSAGTDIQPLIYIDAELAATDADALSVRKPDLPNNHFQYMLTWWSFAIILIIISTLLYRRD